MTYVRIENGIVAEYPVYEGEIRLRYPNISFALPFSPPEGYEAIVDVIPPQIDYTQNCDEGDPILVDGAWTRNWIVTSATPEQIAQRTEVQWEIIRADRNRKLANSDWTQLPDCPLTNVEQTEWATRRQWWRDITNQSDPWNIQWEPS